MTNYALGYVGTVRILMRSDAQQPDWKSDAHEWPDVVRCSGKDK